MNCTLYVSHIMYVHNLSQNIQLNLFDLYFLVSPTTTSATPGFRSADPSLGSFFKDVSAAPQLSEATARPGEDVVATLETWNSQLDKF